MRLSQLFLAAGVLLASLPATFAGAAAEPVRIVALGDSLTAGYGLKPGEGFVPRLEAALKAKGIDAVVVDAGVSGDTTSGGLARLDWSVGPDADAVIVELGANDMLRGVSPAATQKNLDAIVERLTARGLPVLVAGMRGAPNLGPDYVAAFDRLYPEVTEKHGAALYPFFLDGVAGDASLNLPDGIHPTAAGIDIIVERMLPAVEALAAKAAADPA